MTAPADVHLQFQIACTLGQLPPGKSFDPLRKIATGQVRDSLFQIAVLVLADSSELRLLVQKASRVVRSPQSTAAERAPAASVLGLDPTQSSLPLLAEIFTAQQPEEVQFAVARALLGMPDGKATQLVLDNWSMYTPRLREIVLAELLRHPDRVVMLLDATESGKVQLTSLSRSTMGKLYRVGMRD